MHYISSACLFEITHHIINSIFLLQRVSRTCSGYPTLMLKFKKKISVTEKIILDGKEMRENINDTESETKYASGEDPLKILRTTSNETTLISEIPDIINEEKVIIAPGQGKTPISISIDESCKEQTFPYPLPTGKFSYSAPRDISISPSQYFNQRLLNSNQCFASYEDYTFFARSVYEQHHLRSSITFAMHEIKPGI